MAFQQNELSVISHANGFTLWHYSAENNAEDLTATGYFDTANNMLRTGDMMLANCGTGSALKSSILAVSANAGGAVSVEQIAPGS